MQRKIRVPNRVAARLFAHAAASAQVVGDLDGVGRSFGDDVDAIVQGSTEVLGEHRVVFLRDDAQPNDPPTVRDAATMLTSGAGGVP